MRLQHCGTKLIRCSWVLSSNRHINTCRVDPNPCLSGCQSGGYRTFTHTNGPQKPRVQGQGASLGSMKPLSRSAAPETASSHPSPQLPGLPFSLQSSLFPWGSLPPSRLKLLSATPDLAPCLERDCGGHRNAGCRALEVGSGSGGVLSISQVAASALESGWWDSLWEGHKLLPEKMSPGG